MSETFKIGNRVISKNSEPFIIAEAGINHNGDITLARKMISAAKKAGADAIKFQTFHANEFIKDETLTYTYYSQGHKVTESMLEMFLRNEFSENEWEEIKKFCDEQEITFLSTPQNVSDLELLLKLKLEAIKVGSDDFVNLPLIRRYAAEGLPMLLSCGMATESEIDRTLNLVNSINKNPVVLLLCTSQYPTPPKDVNISKLITLMNRYSNIIPGFSDHTLGYEAAVMAIALGAKIFEKHFTLSHNLPGPDHWFSEEPQALKAWVDAIRKSYTMIGCDSLEPTETEKGMRSLAHRSITAIENICSGDQLTEKNIALLRPGKGLSAMEWDNVIGKKTSRDIKSGEQLKWEDIYL